MGGRKRFKNPTEKGSKIQRSFEEKLGETRSRVLNIVLLLLIRRARNGLFVVAVVFSARSL